MPQIRIEKDTCKGCELCVRACPQSVLVVGNELNSRGYFYVQVAEQMQCLGCRLCAIMCPDAAIEIRVHGTMVHYFAY